MKLLGKSSTVLRLLVASGVALTGIATQALAQNADVTEALVILNTALGLPKFNSHHVQTKPALTLATVSNADLVLMVDSIITSSTVGTGFSFPAPDNAAADIANILQLVSADSTAKAKIPAANELMMAAALADLKTRSVSTLSADWNNVVSAAISSANSTGITQASQAKIAGDAIADINTNNPTQLVTVANTVALPLVGNDKDIEKIAKDVVADVPGDGIAIAGNLGSVVSGSDKAVFAKDVAKLDGTDGVGIANAVGATVSSSDAAPVTELIGIALDVNKEDAGSLAITGTSLAQRAVNLVPASVLTTATAFAEAVAKLEPADIAQITGIAASHSTVTGSAAISIGLAVATDKKVIGAGPSTVAAALLASATAAGASSTPIAAGVNGAGASNPVDSAVFEAAAQYAAVAATNSKVAKADDAVVSALAGAAVNPGLNASGNNQAAAAIVYEFINQGLTVSLLNATKGEAAFVPFVDDVVAANPTSAADIFGYAIEDLNAEATGSTWTKVAHGATKDTLQLFETALQGDVITTGTTADPGQAANITAAVNQVLLSATAGGTLADFAGGDGTVVTADESPVVNY